MQPAHFRRSLLQSRGVFDTPTLAAAQARVSIASPRRAAPLFRRSFGPNLLGARAHFSPAEKLPRSRATGRFQLRSGACVIPHPSKVHKGGEDAYFISENGNAIGVADGVGGWAELGVDPGKYSKRLMNEAKNSAEEGSTNDDQKILSEAYQRTNHAGVVGSATAVVLVLDTDKGVLRASNLGDSGFMVVRKGQIVHRSTEQQHSFNFPFQLANTGDERANATSDKPADAEKVEVEVHEGDIVVAGSDGLFDNLYDHEILAIVARAVQEAERNGNEKGLEERLAHALAHRASEVANKTTGLVPFGENARRAMFHFEGGKLDDISVVVSCVALAEAEQQPPPSRAKANL